MYNGEIIQLMGGMNDYIGELDQSAHPNGDGWYRIKNPCFVIMDKDPATQKFTNIISPLSGPPNNNYRKFVDIYIPDSAHMEFRVLDRKGKLYEVYKNSINRKSEGNIIIPSFGSGIAN